MAGIEIMQVIHTVQLLFYQSVCMRSNILIQILYMRISYPIVGSCMSDSPCPDTLVNKERQQTGGHKDEKR